MAAIGTLKPAGEYSYVKWKIVNFKKFINLNVSIMTYRPVSSVG